MQIPAKLSLIILILLLYSFIIQDNKSKTVINEKDKSEMILIDAGQFDFGLTKAQHEKLYTKYNKSFIDDYFIKGKKVKCPGFLIDKYEITNAQFLDFLKSSGYKIHSTLFKVPVAQKNLNLPVNNIGWEDAMAYAKWAGKRLPTEIEWEKAAKGKSSNLWPWGNEDAGQNYNGASQGKYYPVKTGSYPNGKSEYGIMDMAGNVYEMTTGRWNDAPCMKGGSYLNKGFYTMCSFRWAADDTVNGAGWLGFRCVKDLK